MDKQMDMIKLIVTFCNFVNAPKIYLKENNISIT
jgi:hypothetical protein